MMHGEEVQLNPGRNKTTGRKKKPFPGRQKEMKPTRKRINKAKEGGPSLRPLVCVCVCVCVCDIIINYEESINLL